MQPLGFQIAATEEIGEKFRQYMADPLFITRNKLVPFYQNLSAITGSGKTIILADTLQQLRTQLPVEPIILWLSKGKVVVWQTYHHLSTGRYSSLLGGYKVKPLLDCTPADIEDSSAGLLLIATVGKFNQKDKEKGDRKIFQVEFDTADASLWDQLMSRTDGAGHKRPFIIVYDKGHNLSNQQTKLLLDLSPDAIIAASATLRVPEALNVVIERLRQDKRWEDKDFITTVKSSDVVLSGLVKQYISLGGYVTPMETAVDEMLDDMRKVTRSAQELGLPFEPKAIYVSNTNVVSSKAVFKDTVATPFEKRHARPILIWRHLVENRGVDPSEIAVYLDLKFDSKFPPPPSFNLFSGGDNDYDNFIAGDFKHIIFNLTLQEGWDDPACYFAYVDKDMGSADQVTQVIGRVLRQPGARHYSDPSLNTAHFYIRTDEKGVFEEVLNEVESKLMAESPEITLSVYKAREGGAGKPMFPPKREKYLPEVAIDAKNTREPIEKVVNKIEDYRRDVVNTVGAGGRIQVLRTIGSGADAREEWVEVEHSNRVTARWVFTREIQKTYPKAVNLCDIDDPKFDALVEYNSRAAEHIREAAQKVVDAYIDNSVVVQNNLEPVKVPEIPVKPSEVITFKNAVHDGYSGLNSLERDFAAAIDKTKRVWMRNLSRGLFEIPLLDKGGTRNFNPDFLVWMDNALIAIDTKGDHLITEDAGRKVFHINKLGNGPDLLIRLVTQGEWDAKISKLNNNGYTVWLLRNGKVHPIPCKEINEAVQVCLRSE
jgi:type III restriction enzyme